MKIKLLDYKGKAHWVDIPEDTEKVTISIISGDMILSDPIYYDTGKANRLMDFHDGTYVVKREHFGDLNDLTDSYDLESWEED